MNKLKQTESGLRFAAGTGGEIRANASDNTLRAYEHAARKLEAWLEGRALNDAVLAEYIAFLYARGKSPATINLVVHAVKWITEYYEVDSVVGAITTRALARIRGESKGRGRRQVDGLTWEEVERVCAAAESSDTVSGLRDAAMISLMSDCLLRISEVVAVDVGDVTKEGLKLHGKRTGEKDREEVLYICDSTRKRIERYRQRARIASGALIRRRAFPESCDGRSARCEGGSRCDTTSGG